MTAKSNGVALKNDSRVDLTHHTQEVTSDCMTWWPTFTSATQWEEPRNLKLEPEKHAPYLNNKLNKIFKNLLLFSLSFDFDKTTQTEFEKNKKNIDT